MCNRKLYNCNFYILLKVALNLFTDEPFKKLPNNMLLLVPTTYSYLIKKLEIMTDRENLSVRMVQIMFHITHLSSKCDNIKTHY